EEYLKNSSSKGYEEFEDCPRETTETSVEGLSCGTFVSELWLDEFRW
ncbi:8340_t:CDS:2, partial [Gigaspora margarita]